jgi:hypothetical protein
MDDFHQIARRVHRLDPSIAVIPIAKHLHSSLIPKPLLNLPMLVIFLVNPPDEEFHVAGKMAVKHITKLEEYEHFKKHNIPCLPIEEFTWGMTLDKSIYGDWVVLKPQTIQSTGKDVNMVPTDLIPTLKLDDFPEDHLIRQDQYYVQKFVKTGENAAVERVTIFLDEIMYSIKAHLNISFPPENSALSIFLSTSVASNQHAIRTRIMLRDPEVNDFALNLARTFVSQPLFGIDILRCDETKKLYALETNLGGNVWHFSSALAKKTPGYDDRARKSLLLQYKAWDRAAEGLIRKTHMLAK